MQSKYALANPLTKLLDKPRTDFTREDLLTIIEKRQIERITFHYTALDGKLKELKLPIANRRQAEIILTNGERVDGSSLFKGMLDVSLSDLYVVPVYKSAFLNPFDPGSLDFMCRFLTKDGELASFTLDNILQNAYTLFQERTGLEFHVLGELEFFLLSDPERKIYSMEAQRGYHSSTPFIKSGQILNEMVRYISQITESIKYAHSEVGYIDRVRSDLDEIRDKQGEQVEIEFLPRPVDEAADWLVLSRWLIRNVSYRCGCVATFAPKIEEGVAGNGFHFHTALFKDGRNIMQDSNGVLSKEARRVIGGLCTYADSLTAFGNTVSSAYLRLVPNQEAPTRICWSDLNRSAMIRVPLGWSHLTNLAGVVNPGKSTELDNVASRQTVELRSPDGSALIHLLLAGITLAAEWGLTHEESEALADKLYVTGNIFKNKKLLKSLPALPKSCVESARRLLKNRRLYERDGVFTASSIDYIADLLKKENDEHMNERLIDLPADDRLHQTRRIMHKNLHRH